MTDRPALLGGRPVFETVVPILRPTLPSAEAYIPHLRQILETGQITNAANVRAFEAECAERLGVKHCVAVSSCTLGLALTFKALEVTGPVVLPSFTFSASGHAVMWNGLRPVFVDCLPDTWNIDPALAADAVSKNGAILATHLFGNPADCDALEAVARDRGVPLIFDAAHGFGSVYQGRPVGCRGTAEVFSLSPTKLLVSGEGGLVATNEDELARRLRIGRNYGDPGNYDCEFPGLNARMSEFHAILGRLSLQTVDAGVARRNAIAHTFEERLGGLPGLQFQVIADSDRSTYKDFSLIVHADEFGMTRDDLGRSLQAENIQTRFYFYPPLHRQRAYAAYRDETVVPITDALSDNVISLPIYARLTDAETDGICRAIERTHAHAGALAGQAAAA